MHKRKQTIMFYYDPAKHKNETHYKNIFLNLFLFFLNIHNKKQIKNLQTKIEQYLINK